MIPAPTGTGCAEKEFATKNTIAPEETMTEAS
jgi:hypothetical protein